MNLFDVLFAKKLAGGGSPFPPVIKRVTGNPVEFSDGADAPLVKCVTEITGSQDLHGYDKPWVGGAGKNKLDPLYKTSGSTNVYFYQNDGFLIEAGKTYTLSCDTVIDTISVRLLDNTTVYTVSNSNALTFTPSENMTVFFRFRNDGGVSTIADFQLELGASPTAYAPYSNICPITAYTEGEIEVSDGDGNTTTHTTTYPSAIYRGSEDVVNGSVIGNWVCITFDGTEDNIGTSTGVNRFRITCGMSNVKLSNHSNFKANYLTPTTWGDSAYSFGLRNDGNVYIMLDNTAEQMTVEQFRSYLSTNPITIAYELENPTTSPVTPTNLPIKSLSGYNHIESSTGDMVIDYITDQYQNFVDTTERAIPSTRKGGLKALDVFMTLDNPSEDTTKESEKPIDSKGEQEGMKK